MALSQLLIPFAALAIWLIISLRNNVRENVDRGNEMKDKEHAVMDEIWRNVNSLRWQHNKRLEAIRKYRDWLPECKDAETRKYYVKWLDFMEKETMDDQEVDRRRERVKAMNIEKPN